MISKEVKRYLSELGKAGGSAGTGSAKVRGDAEYYRKMSARGLKTRRAKAKERHASDK